MQLVQISDCHLFADINKVGYQQINPYQSLKRILSQISHHTVDLLLVTGDVSGDGSAESYQHFKRLITEMNLSCDISIIPGNHDTPHALKSEFPEHCLWNRSPLEVDQHEWQIHLINTHHQGTLGQVSAEDLARLDNQLRQYPDKYHLIATHHHPIECNSWMDKHAWLNRSEFMDLVTKHKGVKAVIYGHIHSDNANKQNGIHFMACPSTCWQWENSKSFAVSHLMPGFRVINLLENGQISTSVNRLT
ncbi:metallophosphoesterase family protein [Paraglaciecola sp.]|uniref:metallophosphoesterase family protein n=1 Tax=Paraglaciecola sp. TaxID=1920173 RepID=UPI003EF9D0A6